MSTFSGILLDVSGSMEQNATGSVDTEGGEWVRSIFKVTDNLIKYDVSSDNHVFVVAVGASCKKEIFDVIGTVKEFHGRTNNDNRSYSQIVERTYRLLEQNGAFSIRRWATEDVIRSAVSYELASLLLSQLEFDRSFLRHFVDECLPAACKDLSSNEAIKGIQYLFSIAVTAALKKATKEDVEEVVRGAKSKLLKDINPSCIVSVHEASNILHGCVDEQDLTSERIKSLMRTVKPFIYGLTPLYTGLGKAVDLFRTSRYNQHKQLLFVLSDGHPTDDGNLADLISKLKRENVTVVSCYITRSTSVEAKRLYSSPGYDWDEEAKFLFNLSSTVPTQLLPRTIFIKRGWTIDISNNETKLFLHVNHPDILEDACDLVRNVVCCQDALSDALVSISLDIYINQSTSTSGAPDQVGGTCYANASATVLHLSMKRILGRDGGYPDFNTLRQEMIDHYGRDGAVTFDVLRNICPKYRLQCKEVEVTGALEAITAKRPVVAIFRLTDKEWQVFKTFYRNHKTKILTKRELNIKRPTNLQQKGHAVVLTSFNSKCLRLMNSWGTAWADMGFFRVENATVLDLKFIDVYWTDNSLTSNEKSYYKTHGASVAATLIRSLKGLQNAQYTCPRCSRTSLVTAFTGTLLQATCPLCRESFDCGNAGNILALNMYLLSLSR